MPDISRAYHAEDALLLELEQESAGYRASRESLINIAESNGCDRQALVTESPVPREKPKKASAPIEVASTKK